MYETMYNDFTVSLFKNVYVLQYIYTQNANNLVNFSKSS